MTTANNHSNDGYIRVKDAALCAGVSSKTITRWMCSGLFGFKRKNRKERLVNEAEFQRYITELTSPVSQSTT